MYKPNVKAKYENFSGNFEFTQRVYERDDTMECIVRFSPLSDLSIIWLEAYVVGYYKLTGSTIWGIPNARPVKKEFMVKPQRLYGSPDSLPTILMPDYQGVVKCSIESDFPPSFVHRFAKVKYVVYIYARRRDQPDARIKAKFRVKNSVIRTPELLEPMESDNAGSTRLIFNSCQTTGTVHINHKGYLLNEVMEVDLIVRNLSPHELHFRNVQYQLVRHIYFKLHRRECKDTVVTGNHYMQPVIIVDASTRRLCWKMRIPGSCLPSCETNAVDIKYELFVHFTTERVWSRWCRQSVTLRVPLYICSKEKEGTPDSTEYPFLHLPQVPIPTIQVEYIELQQLAASQSVYGLSGLPDTNEPIPGPSRSHSMPEAMTTSPESPQQPKDEKMPGPDDESD